MSHEGALAEASLRPHLERGARWRLLSSLLEPPRPGRQERLRTLVSETPLGFDADLEPALAPDDGALIAEHFACLRPAGCVSACASDYIEGGFADKGPILADIAGFYRAFGFEPELREAPDHFANLLACLAFLAVKQAYMMHLGDGAQARLAQEAEAKLFREHVRSYLERFAANLADVAPEGSAYGAIARVIATACEEPCQ
ncbi:MAG: molecular chaperone TorD family protein [Planctomycetota bacterium]